jgi:predicted negative regulator of RcsB-dependent stress response
MKTTRLFIVLLILGGLTQPAFATFIFNENCRQAYTDMMHLRFAKASERLNIEKRLHPENQSPYIIENYIDFLKVMIGEEEADFHKLIEQKSYRLQKLSANGEQSPWFLYSQALVYLQSGLAHAKFGEYLNAGLDVNRGYKLLEQNNEFYPAFAMNNVCLGILQALIGTVPAKYKWAVKSLKFEGTIEGGKKMMQKGFNQIMADPSTNFLVPETIFLYLFVNLNITADAHSANAIVKKIRATPQLNKLIESPLIRYAIANVSIHNGENDQAIQILSGYKMESNSYPFYYLSYLSGVCRLNRLDSDACFPLLNFLGNFKGKNYIRSAYMHLAWYYLINNDLEKYNLYISRIPLRGYDQVDNDKEALTFATSNQKPEIQLLKARLLFDGGYYERALHELNSYSPSNQRFQLELSYRKGRIYHQWGKTAEAIPYYNQTIKAGRNLPFYYAANAALQLGLIYENKADYAHAKACFTQVLEMDFEEYKFSISNKAQAGLNRIRSKM